MEKHIADINAFIPVARKIARQQCVGLPEVEWRSGGADGRERPHYFFTEFFHRAMDQLTRDAGLRTGNIR